MGTPTAFHPVATTTQVEIRYTLNGVEAENVFHYRWNNSTPPSQAELASLVNEVEATLVNKFQQLTASGWVYRETYAKNIHAAVADQAVINSSLATFHRAGDTLPGNVSAWLVKRTGFTGRSQHGGVNVSGFSEGDVALRQLSTALVNLLINLALSFVANRVGGRFIPAVASRKLGQPQIMRAMALTKTTNASAKTRNK